MEMSRRKLLSTAAVGVPAIALAGCGLFTQNANGSYGLSAAAISFIQTAVNIANQYVPSAESIAAIVASFIPGGASVVTIGSTAINEVIAYLENIVASPPTLGAKLKATGGAAYSQFNLPTPPSSKLVGYAKNGLPIYAQ
jgi:hypothetical protein